MKRKIITFLILISVLFTMSCKKPGSGEYTQDGYYKYNEEKELTIAWLMSGNVVDTMNTPTIQRAKELTNIKLKNVLSKSTTDWRQALNMLIATENTPDIMHMYEHRMISQYIRQGVLKPLDELIDKHAPNIKKYFEKNPDHRKTLEWVDGKIYYIPCIADGGVSMGWFIRTDWLKNLNLSVPQTVEEYYNVLKAFKTQDPNGNGIADEIPYFNRNAAVNYDTAITCLFPMWGTSHTMYEKDGRMVYGPYEPEFKEAIKNIAAWYREGLIDPEIYTRGSNAREQLFGENIGGSTYDWFGTTAQFNQTLKNKIGNFSVEAIPPPAGYITDKRETVKAVGWGISSNSHNDIESIRYMDFWFTQEGSLLANYGIEGETYDMVDGKPVFKKEIINSDVAVVNKLNEYGVQLNMGYKQDFDYERQWLSPQAIEGMDMYQNNNYIRSLYSQKIILTDGDKTRVNEIEGTISDYVKEIQQKWVLGTLDIDASYDEYIATLKNMHVEEMIAIYQKLLDEAKQ